MKPSLKDHITQSLNSRIISAQPLSGGDISQAYLLETTNGQFFCKVNSNPDAEQMFAIEKAGLEVLKANDNLKIPKVLGTGKHDGNSFLVLEYIEYKQPNAKDFERLGHGLAKLHSNTQSQFGWERDNYIGSLPQENTLSDNWPDFYVTYRLLPQLRMAKAAGLLKETELPNDEKLFSACEGLFPDIKPALLHGDLWCGNFLISKNGTPYLIDPATYYGHHEVDIAMTRLFGGFGEAFYRAYVNSFPKERDAAARNDIYQLYYLLVHLNLFGRSYRGGVMGILDRYFC